MRIYATRRQAEMVVIAMMSTFGSNDSEALKLIDNVNKCLLNQRKDDKTHYEGYVEGEKDDSSGSSS